MAKVSKQIREQFEEFLGGLGFQGGEFTHLIIQAIQEDWSATEFQQALKESPRFQRMFPGLVEKDGTINVLLGNTLGSAVYNYRRWQDAYAKIAKGRVHLTTKMMGVLVAGHQSPDEFGARLNAVSSAQANPELLAAFNEELVAAGKKPLDETGWLKFLAKTGPTKFYDIYEAAQLRASTLALGPDEALALARGVGTPGQPADIGAILKAINAIKPQIAPELARMGITDEDLVLLESGADPNNMLPKIRQLLAQRAALGKPVTGTYGGYGAGGGLRLYEPQGAAAAG